MQEKVSNFSDHERAEFNKSRDFFASKGAKWTKHLPLVGNFMLGAALTMTAAESAEAMERGDKDEAKAIWIEFGLKEFGSEVMGILAGAATGAALTAVGAPAAVVGALGLGAAILGGYLTEESIDQYAGLIRDRDANGVRDLFDQVENFLEGVNGQLPDRLPPGYTPENRYNLDMQSGAAEMAAKARSSLAYRFALVNLSPFVITDYDYSPVENDPKYSYENYTEQYWQDRAQMAYWRIQYELQNLDVSRDLNTGGMSGNYDFVDMGTALAGGDFMQLSIDGSGITVDDHKIIFGSDRDDEIAGSGDTDRLYGGDGNDTVAGGEEEDYLEGGKGDDILNGGSRDATDDGVTDQLYGGEGVNRYLVDGHDIILLRSEEDTEGAVFLTKDDEQLELKEAVHAEGDPEGEYKDSNDNKYVFDGDALVINGGLRIEGFKKWARTSTASDGSTIWSALGITVRNEGEEDDEPDKSEAEGVNSPIIIDLNGNGVETLAGRGIHFDHEGDGMKERTGWVAATDGFLVRDLNGDGRITTGQELFGNNTRLRDGSTASHGYRALTELDDNLDGSIDSRDKVWSTLNIWQDKNSNGKTDAGEMYSLAEAGITAISTRYASSTRRDENGEYHRQTGSVTLTDGTTAASADVWFEVDKSDRSLINDIPLTPDIIRLPNARGFGDVPDLRQAMAHDKILQQIVNDYLAETDSTKKYDLLDKLIYQWTGVQDVSNAQKYNITLRQVAVLERLTGSVYDNKYLGSDIGKNASVSLAEEYQQFKDYTEAQLVAQTTLYEELKEVVLTGFNSGVLGVVLNIDAAESLYKELYQSGQYDRLRDVSGALIHLSVYSEYNRQELADLRHNLISRDRGMADYLVIDPEYSGKGDDIPSDTEIPEPTSGDDILRADEYKNIWGGAGNDTYLVNAGEGHITIADYVSRDEERESFADTDKEHERAMQAGQDTLRFGEGLTSENAIFSREWDDLVITFKDGSDSVTVQDYFYSEQYKIEKIVFGDGVVLDMAGISARMLAGTDADQTLNAEIAGSEIHAGGGDDTLRGLWGDDLLYGDSGDDELSGDSGNDSLSGGTGDDLLSGGDGDDVLHGGAGIDELAGGEGTDTFIFNAGDGIDVISAGSYYDRQSETAQDTLRFGTGIRPEQLMLSRLDDSLVIRLDGGEDIVGIADYFSDDAYRLAQIVFADGTVWDADTIASRIVRTLDEAVTHTASEEGGRFKGGNNNDTLTGMSGEDSLLGGEGDDWLTGGAGEDYLNGGEGSDTYVFNAGDGQDSVGEFADGCINTLRFGEGLLAENALAENDYGSLIIRFRDSEDSITLYDYFDSKTPPLTQIIFADGTVWTWDAVRAMVLEGTDGAQDLSAFSEGSEIHAGGGDDRVRGGYGNDILYGDGGDDVLSDHAGHNILAGGAGNDTLRGGDDDDTYLFNAGDGQDVIRESFWDFGEADILRFGDGLQAGNARLSRSGDDLIVSFAGSADRVTMEEYFCHEEGLIEQIVFADGTAWNASDIKAMLLAGTDEAQTLIAFNEGSEIHAGGGDDMLEGRYGNDTLFGDAGDDVLSDTGGRNILAGGTGNDTLNGGFGNDTYLFNAGDGHDVITEYSRADDTLRFGEGLLPDNVVLMRNGDDLIIGFANSSDQVTVEDYFTVDEGIVEQIVFADGTVWNASTIKPMVLAGTDEAQTLTAFNEGSEIHAGGGDDTLEGRYGNDILAGGTGNDILRGYGGSDIYLFNAGDGQDVIYENTQNKSKSDTETLRFGEGLLADNAVLVRKGSALIISFSGSNDQVMVENYFRAEEGIVEQIVFADGTTWNIQSVGKRLLTGTDEAQNLTALIKGSEIHAAGGDDTVHGDVGNDALYGDAGNDEIDGFRGEDTLFGGTGDDLLYGDDADDLLAGGEDNDTLNGDNGNDILYGDDGTDTLNGGSGNDWLSGGEGSDTLDSGSGSDTLAGGTGNDALIGGYGSDSYLFGAGDGQDTINEGYTSTGDTDTLRFGEGLLAENAIVKRSGDNLVIGFAGSTDSITVQSYFTADKYRVENITFADGTVWDVSAVKAMLLTGTEEAQTLTAYDEGSEIHAGGGNDTLNGVTGSDVLYGDAGDDVLDSGSGSDTLTGGTGNDTLKGYYGSDIYQFSAGDGQDTITEGYTSTGDTDTLRFGEGLLAENAVVQRSGDDLVISFRDSTDSVKVTDYFYSSKYQVESILFADGTVWDVAAVKQRLMDSAGTDEAQTITAFSEGSEIHGRGGNDTLNGVTGSDVLYGDAGDDVLDSGSGSDTLTGGTGNDTLKGYYGSDTYLFNAGDGQDTI
ncbi:calcium-binding protein, partial [Enterobacter sp.]|uniref:calcium-binding protein n=1 Tax=Enterobacter sp. TaxID=42895 RepID=UPI002981AE89